MGGAAVVVEQEGAPGVLGGALKAMVKKTGSCGRWLKKKRPGLTPTSRPLRLGLQAVTLDVPDEAKHVGTRLQTAKIPRSEDGGRDVTSLSQGTKLHSNCRIRRSPLTAGP